MRAVKRLALALVLGSAVAACVISSFREGQFSCTQGAPNACPEGLICARDGLCRTQDIEVDATIESGPIADAEVADGGIDCPDARFSVVLEARRPTSVAATDDGRVFVSGVQNGQGWIAELHPCDGRILRERAIPGALSFEALTLSGEEIVAVGAATGTNRTGLGRFARDLSTISFLPIDGYGGPSHHVNVGASGAIWVAGPRTTTTGFAALTGTCSVNLPTTPGGIVANNQNALVLVRGATVATLERVLATCAREDGGVATIKAGASDVRPRALVPLATGFAAIGNAVAPTPRNGTLVWVATSTASGLTWTLTELDPNPNDADEGRALAFDGESLFAGVSQRAVANGGVPTLYRYPLPLVRDAQPEWSVAPFGSTDQREMRGVATTKTGDAVFVVAADATNGAFARCNKKGQCR